MEVRATKLRRLGRFQRQLPHTTASALSAILSAVAEEGAPDLASRANVREARDLDCVRETSFGPIAQTVPIVDTDGVVQDLNIAHPFALLHVALESCAAFRVVFEARLRAKPPSHDEPWSLVIYSDEVTPGNVISPNNMRKFQALYWTLLEFGTNAWARESSWFPIVSEYSRHVNKFNAGLSQAMSAVLKVFFPPSGFNIADGGIPVPVDGDVKRIFVVLKMMIQDGGAHKQVWHHRGDAASKLCLLCKNLVTGSSDIVAHDESRLLQSNVIKKSDLVPSTDSDVRSVYRYIAAQAGTMSKDSFKQLQQALGFTYHSHALLLDRYLDAYVHPVRIYTHDWMHALLVDGTYNLVLLLVLEECRTNGVPNVWDALEGYVTHWEWPARVGSCTSLSDVFSSTRRNSSKQGGHIKCQASDLLSLYPVVAVFVMTVLVPTGVCAEACSALLALSDVLDFITAVPRTKIEPRILLEAVERFLALFASVWGWDKFIPKMHWLLHLPGVLQRCGTLLNCFVLGRKHSVMKRYATEMTIRNRTASRTLIREASAHQLSTMQDPWAWSFEIGLVRPRPASAALARTAIDMFDLPLGSRVHTAVESRFSPVATCKRGDAVLFRSAGSLQAAIVRCHLECDSVAVAIVSPYSLVKADRKVGVAEWRSLPDDIAIEIDEVLDTVIWARIGAGRVRTIIPCELR